MPSIRVTVVSGSLSASSRTRVLAEALVSELARHISLQARVLPLASIARALGGALQRSELPAAVEEAVQSIEQAELLVVATPVYRASYPGLLKHLFDHVALDALINTPVLLAATGGSERHALVIEHQLRPLFGFFQALTLPVGVYASAADFQDQTLQGHAIHARIALAAERAAALFDGERIGLRRTA